MSARDTIANNRGRIGKLAAASAVAGALSITAWALLPVNRLLDLLLVHGPLAVMLGLAAVLLGPVAILLAVGAFVTVPPDSGLRGRSWAAAGLVLGCVGFLLNPTWGRLRHDYNAARHYRCLSNLKQVAAALVMYSNDFDGRLPDGARPGKPDREVLDKDLASPYNAAGTTR